MSKENFYHPTQHIINMEFEKKIRREKENWPQLPCPPPAPQISDDVHLSLMNYTIQDDVPVDNFENKGIVFRLLHVSVVWYNMDCGHYFK